MARKIIQQYAGKDGWCKWVSPKMNQSYLLVCCDCGLAHDFQFQVQKLTKRLPKGRWEGKQVHGMKVIWRCRRNKRSTGQVRRWQKKGAKRG